MDFFNLLSTLLNQTPLGTFTQHAAVEWIHSGTSHTPIILDPIIIEQCRTLLLDSWVSILFNIAMNDEMLGTDFSLRKKTEKDLKYEKEMTGISAMKLAANEARLERGIWRNHQR